MKEEAEGPHFLKMEWGFLSGTPMKRLIIILLVILSLILFGEEVNSTIFGKPLSFQELTDKSALVIVGTIIKMDSSWNAERTKIFTFIRIDVEDYVKGQGERTLTIRVPGGTADGITEVHSGNPTFSVGEKVLLFLNPGHPYSDIVGAYQGKYTIIDNEVLGKEEPANELIHRLKIMSGKESPGSKLSNPLETFARMKLDVPLPKDVEPVQFRLATPSPTTTYNLVMSQGFEGSFPTTGWTVMSPNGAYWGLTNDKWYSGSKSAWCARGGPYGVDPYYYYYPDNVDSWMIYGPFSLANIQSAFFQFYHWSKTEPSHDYFKWMASTDGQYFYGFSFSGDSGGWKQLGLDLTNVPTLGNVCGQSYVWIAFRFQSDTDGVVDDGTYIDDIALYVSTAPAPPSITSVYPSSASAGTNSMVTIYGNSFGAAQGQVFFLAKRENLSVLSAQIVSWSDTQIKCYVPTGIVNSYPYSAGSFNDAIVVYNGQPSNNYPFNVTFGYAGEKWSGNIVYYYVNENTSDCTGEGAAVQRAANTWSSNANFNLSYAGPTSATDYAYNGKNEILWKDLGTGTTLAETLIGWNDASGNILERDIVFNDYCSWSTSSSPSSGQFDVETIALHEFGHWLTLLDLYGDNDSSKVMYGINNGAVKRSLTLGDIAGIQYIYGAPPTTNSYTVTTSPPGLQISVDNYIYTAPYTFNWTPGSSHTLSVSSPQNGTSGTRYAYYSWSDGGAQTHTITAPPSSATYTATFTTQYALTTSVSPSGEGTAYPLGTNWYNSGQTVSISATANSGYTFANWTGDVPNPPNPISSIQITMNGPKNVTANFSQNCTYTLTVNINSAGWGTVSKSPDKSAYCLGDQVTLTASPNQGYTFSSWSGVDSSNGQTATVTMNGNRTATANFTQNPQYTLNIIINPSGSGSVAKNPNKATYTNTDQVTLTATPNSGYSFGNWTGDANGNANPINVTMNGNKTVTANFTQQYTLMSNVNPSGSGSVSKNPDKSTYSSGDQVTLTATPNSGYTFTNWSGDASGTTNQVTLMMNGNKTVTANFTATNTIGPDLTGSWTTPVSQTCKTSKKGKQCTIKGTLTVRNIGNRDAPSTFVGFYLSDSENYNEGGGPFKRLSTSTIKAGKSKAIKLNYNLLLGQSASNKYIVAVIDPGNLVTETDETNNIVASGPIQ